MRDIKFRAWDADRKKMIYRFKNNRSQTPALLQNDNEDEYNFFCGSYQQNGDWQEPELMQYTGLKDNNGKEIYEGDICNVTYYNHSSPNTNIKQEVVFENGTFVLKSKLVEKLKLKLEDTRQLVPIYYCFAPNKIEIIGNIYQNQDLL